MPGAREPVARGALPAVAGAVLAVSLAVSRPAASQEAAKDKGPIQDNSFLMEEAYNQDPRVVQHINGFLYSTTSDDWLYTFTQEWPLFGLTHQLSYTLPIAKLRDGGGATKLGDVALNYRYQLAGNGEAAFACAPRFTVLLPTGDARGGYGAGAAGFQVGVPVSLVLSPRFVTHANAGLTFTPRAKGEDGGRADTLAFNLGSSLVWLTGPSFNVLVEAVFARAQRVVRDGVTERDDSFLISPGIRWAHDFKSGLQIVPGIAFPIGAGPSAGERSIFLYLSFEHPF